MDDSATGEVVGATPRGGETAAGATDSGTVAAATAFDQTVELRGITFHVTCPNDSSVPTLTIVPAGLEIDNSPIVRRVEGPCVHAEIADLNVDGSPKFTSTRGRWAVAPTRRSSPTPRTTRSR